MASAARTARLNFEEFDLENEVDLVNFMVQARLVYDNITNTPVFQYLGQALSQNGYNAAAVTVSVDTDSPADLTPGPTYPCASVYGDAAQVLRSSELLAAVSGYTIGFPWGGTPNGSMLCNGSPYNPNTGKPWMQSIPSQGSSLPAVVDMHAKPCMQIGSNGNYTCDYTNSQNSSATQTQAAQDTWSMAWDFVYYRYLYNGLPQPLTIFGETWSNSNESCNGNPDASLTQSTVSGYRQSCLSGNTACFVNGASTQAGVNPNPSSVVFRPWGMPTGPPASVKHP